MWHGIEPRNSAAPQDCPPVHGGPQDEGEVCHRREKASAESNGVGVGHIHLHSPWSRHCAGKSPYPETCDVDAPGGHDKDFNPQKKSLIIMVKQLESPVFDPVRGEPGRHTGVIAASPRTSTTDIR